MKFAQVGEQRLEAQSGLAGVCPGCGLPVFAKCGNVRMHHWAHRGACNSRWEPETRWHRDWKENFPTIWQEVIHPVEGGGRHIADVKTPQGWAIEFQHSHIQPEERHSREAFYENLVWVVDGRRLKRDLKQFGEALKSAIALVPDLPVYRLRDSAEPCVLLQKWTSHRAMVFFDFGGPYLWGLFPVSPRGGHYVAIVPRNDFVERHLREPMHERSFSALVIAGRAMISRFESPPTPKPPSPQPPNPRSRFPNYQRLRYIADARRKGGF